MRRSPATFWLAALLGAAPAPVNANAVFVEPVAAGSHDSDGNRTFGSGVGVDFTWRPGVQLGFQSLRTRVEDDATRGIVDDQRLRTTLRPARAWRIEATAGAARFAPPAGAAPWRAVGGLRMRWRAPRSGPALELRLDRAALIANPLLLANHAMRSDGRFGFDLPAQRFRVRGTVRGSLIESAGERNVRGEVDGALAMPLSPAVTPFIQYRSLGYGHPANTGYFAPHRVEIAETGSSFELGTGSPWLLSLDVGAGLQRIQAFGDVMGTWRPALRGYGYLSYTTHGGCELRLEAENENSPGLATSSSENWRYGSLNAGVRWAFR